MCVGLTLPTVRRLPLRHAHSNPASPVTIPTSRSALQVALVDADDPKPSAYSSFFGNSAAVLPGVVVLLQIRSHEARKHQRVRDLHVSEVEPPVRLCAAGCQR